MSDSENMAEAAVHPPSAPRFFCHKCTEDIRPVLPDYICPRCRLGFVEEVSQGRLDGAGTGHTGHSHSDESSEDDVDPFFQEVRQLFGLEEFLESGRGRRGRGERVMPRPQQPRSSTLLSISPEMTEPPPILQFLLTSLTEGRTGLMNADRGANNPIYLTLHGNPGDYAWGRGNFDAIITHLLNQLDGTGPPPLPRDKIQEIPTVQISQDQVEKNLQCTVCMEDFKVEEPVRRLKCEHHFHTTCITPWLELHGTCPICRCSLHDQANTTEGQSVPGSSHPLHSSRAYEYSEDFD